MDLIMPSYEESNIPATTWRRAKQVIINNSYQGEKYVSFIEEDIVALDNNKYIAQDCSCIQQTYVPGQMIPLRDPITNELTGSSIPQDIVYQALASLYMNLVESREQLIAAGGTGNMLRPLG